MRLLHPYWLPLFLASVAVVCTRAGVGAPLEVTAPRFRGATLPVPPLQDERWAAPASNGPDYLSSAVELLFEQGLADPRGCEYREIEVSEPAPTFALSFPRGTERLATHHGWVLPVKRGDLYRFAIQWDGLIYPVAGVGKFADLSRDVNIALHRDSHFRRRTSAKNAARLTLEAGPVLPYLLWRLGEVELSRETQAEFLPGKNPDWIYLDAAGDWADHLFDRAVRDHMRGEDRLSLLRLRTLDRARSLIVAEAVHRGLVKKEEPLPQALRGTNAQVLASPDVDTLLADQERRARERVESTGRLTEGGRVEPLVRNLDQVDVQASPSDNPARPQLVTDRRVQAVIKEGQSAVLPLADCLANDHRLTRSIDYWKSAAFSGRMVPVADAAYIALSAILGVKTLEELEAGLPAKAGTPEFRQALAQRIREHVRNR